MTQETDNQPVTETEDEKLIREFFRDYGPSSELRYHSRTLRIIEIDYDEIEIEFSYEDKNGMILFCRVKKSALLDIIQFNQE